MSYRAMTRRAGGGFRFLRRSLRLALDRQRDGRTDETKDDFCCICLVADRRIDARLWDEHCCLRCTASICPDCLPRWLRAAGPLKCPLCRFGMRCSGCAPPPSSPIPRRSFVVPPWIAPPPPQPWKVLLGYSAVFAILFAIDVSIGLWKGA